MTSINRGVFDTFYADLDSINVDGLVDAFAEDGSYHDMPVPTDPAVGKEAIRSKLERGLTKLTRCECNFQVVVEDDDRILSERFEVWHLPDGTKVELQVMSIMEFSDGKVTHLREYWDRQTTTRQLPPGAFGASADAADA
jgi:limonene-1,2-epoxide hydrolase